MKGTIKHVILDKSGLIDLSCPQVDPWFCCVNGCLSEDTPPLRWDVMGPVSGWDEVQILGWGLLGLWVCDSSHDSLSSWFACGLGCSPQTCSKCLYTATFVLDARVCAVHLASSVWIASPHPIHPGDDASFQKVEDLLLSNKLPNNSFTV